MLTAAAGLGLFAVLLAVPVPLALARADWTQRAPGTAALLWQGIALAGGLSMIGALALLGLAAFGDRLPDAVTAFSRAVAEGDATVPVLPLLGLGAAVLLLAHLLLNLLLTTVVAARERARHRALVSLLSSPLPDRPGAHLIDDPAPVAYCVPGDGEVSATVVSAGLVDLLQPDELGAVIAHERAHLTQRHHLLTTAFQAWSLSLPWFPIASASRREVALLVELLADDRALRSTAPDALRRAIALVAGTASEQAATARVRIARIGAPPLPGWARGLAIAATIGILSVPAGLLLTTLA